MSLQSLRHRRLLSMTRRSGPQLPLDVASGRTPRHAQGWRDMQPEERAPILGIALCSLALWVLAIWIVLRVIELLL